MQNQTPNHYRNCVYVLSMCQYQSIALEIVFYYVYYVSIIHFTLYYRHIECLQEWMNEWIMCTEANARKSIVVYIYIIYLYTYIYYIYTKIYIPTVSFSLPLSFTRLSLHSQRLTNQNISISSICIRRDWRLDCLNKNKKCFEFLH